MRAPLRLILATGTGLSLLAGAAIAQSDEQIEDAVGARQSLMHLYAFNLGLLGGMAEGEIDYDGAAAEAAAASLVDLSSVDQSRMWPEGSSTEALGEDTTSALPAIWENRDDFFSQTDQLNAAATEMEAAAGESLEALRGSMGPLGNSCGSCHEDYRASND